MNGEGTVTVIVTALAASAASIIAMAGDRILMHPVAYMMIHNPWTIAMGDAKELRKTAKTLDVISEGLVSAYETRTGKDREELKKLLDAETWMSAATCVEEGFADEIYGAGTDGVGTGAAACALRPVMMSAKAHGVQEIAKRIQEEPAVPDPGLEAMAAEARKRQEIIMRAEIAQRAAIAAAAI
jgi:ATP-dependent Clp protease protease subunit